MKTSITSNMTDGQIKQYRRFVEDATTKGADLALEKVNLDKDGLQKLIENGDEFNAVIAEVIIKKTQELSVSNQFASEEVKSKYGYLSGYKPKYITEQTNALRALFPGIGFADEKLTEQPLPKNAEGWFAIPRWEKIAPTYGEAVEKVLELIKKNRNGNLINYRKDQLSAKYLRQSAKMVKAFEKLGNEQKGYDILIVPAQLGLCHRGRSVRRAREVMNSFEFGLGAFAIGIILLTHPERLQHLDDLWVDCAGDEYSPDGVGDFSGSLIFGFYDGEVRFDRRYVGVANVYYGSCSGFLPQ